MAVKLEIKDYFSSDIDHIWEWKPTDPSLIHFKLDVYIGEENQNTSTIFSFIVTSAEALADKTHAQKSASRGRGYLVIKDYTFEKLESAINELIKKHCKGKETALEVFQSLDKELFWEYSHRRLSNQKSKILLLWKRKLKKLK